VSYDLYLSYSGRKSYLTCPLQYWHRYVAKTKFERDPRTSFFGSIFGKVFEWFYVRRFWAGPDPVRASLEAVPEAVRFVLKDEGFHRASDPAYVDNVEADVRELIPSAVETVRMHHLLAPNSHAELDLKVTYRSEKHGLTLRLGGRADFAHYHSPKDVWIVDGKGSRHREKFVDSEQVIWYATQHYLKFHVAPTRIGFIYWRFPQDPVQWVDYSGQSIRDSLDLTFDVAKRVRLGLFDPRPSSECHGCDYKGLCEDGTKYLAERKVASGGRIESSIFDLDQVT